MKGMKVSLFILIVLLPAVLFIFLLVMLSAIVRKQLLKTSAIFWWILIFTTLIFQGCVIIVYLSPCVWIYNLPHSFHFSTQIPYLFYIIEFLCCLYNSWQYFIIVFVICFYGWVTAIVAYYIYLLHLQEIFIPSVILEIFVVIPFTLVMGKLEYKILK